MADELAVKNKSLKKHLKEYEQQIRTLKEEVKAERQLRITLQSEKNYAAERLQQL